MIPEPLRVTLAVAKALERMGIPYFVGGSLASSAHGVARSTLDAATRRSSFTVIHIATAFKVDVFVPRATAYAEIEMERRQSHVIDPTTGESMAFSTAGDTLLAKLQCCRQGNEVSERQWRDVLGIPRITGRHRRFARSRPR